MAGADPAGGGLAYFEVYAVPGIDYTWAMTNPPNHDDGSPKFGRLLVVLLAAVVFCGLLTWIMAVYFPNFPS